MDQDIVNYARREYNLFLGERTAEDIKIAIGSAYPGDWDSQRVTLRGRDLLTGLPRSVEVGADQIREAIEISVVADRRHHQGHDRGDAAGARGRHHGPGHRARRRRRAARGPRPAGRRGDPDAGPRRRRPADLRRPRHRRRAPAADQHATWSGCSSPTPTAARRADGSPPCTARRGPGARPRSRAMTTHRRRAKPGPPPRHRVRDPDRDHAAADGVLGQPVPARVPARLPVRADPVPGRARHGGRRDRGRRRRP